MNKYQKLSNNELNIEVAKRRGWTMKYVPEGEDDDVFTDGWNLLSPEGSVLRYIRRHWYDESEAWMEVATERGYDFGDWFSAGVPASEITDAINLKHPNVPRVMRDAGGHFEVSCRVNGKKIIVRDKELPRAITIAWLMVDDTSVEVKAEDIPF